MTSYVAISSTDASQTPSLACYATIPGGDDVVPFQCGMLQLSPVYATPRPPRGHRPPFPLYSTPPHFRWPCGKCVSGKPQCHDTNVRHFWLLDSFTRYRLVSQWLCASSTRTLTSPTSSAHSASQ